MTSKSKSSSRNAGDYGNIGHLQAVERCIEVDNPYYQKQHSESVANPVKITTTINAAGNPIAIMHKKKHITDPQKMAADRFYRYWIVSHGGENMGLDYRRQKVDGGKFVSHTMIRPIEADQELTRIRNKLGVMGYDLVECVAGHGKPIAHLSANKQKQNILGHNLRDCLDVLAEFWGYAPPKTRYY